MTEAVTVIGVGSRGGRVGGIGRVALAETAGPVVIDGDDERSGGAGCSDGVGSAVLIGSGVELDGMEMPCGPCRGSSPPRIARRVRNAITRSPAPAASADACFRPRRAPGMTSIVLWSGANVPRVRVTRASSSAASPRVERTSGRATGDESTATLPASGEGGGGVTSSSSVSWSPDRTDARGGEAAAAPSALLASAFDCPRPFTLFDGPGEAAALFRSSRATRPATSGGARGASAVASAMTPA